MSTLRLVGRASLAFGILFVALSFAFPGDGDPCFEYSAQTKPAMSGGGLVPQHDGAPLTDDEAGCVQKAIDAIAAIDACMEAGGGSGLSTDTPEGGQPADLGAYLEQLKQDGKICRETIAKPGTVAHASRGNGYFEDHPGINIQPPYLKCTEEDGTTDPAAVIGLVHILVHESSHLTNPPAVTPTQDALEKPAYEFTAEVLCSMLPCIGAAFPGEDEDAMKKLLCEGIKAANEEACKRGGAQMECTECEALGVSVIVEGDCPPDPPAEPGPGGASSPGGSSHWEYQNLAWAFGTYRGTLSLRPWDKDLRVFVSGHGQQAARNVDLSTIGGEAITPVSMCLLGNNEILVAGTTDADWFGRLYRLTFDPADPTLPVNVVTLYSGGAFSWPTGITTSRLSPANAFIFDEYSHGVYRFNLASSTLVLVADAAFAPELVGCRYASHEEIYWGDNGSGQPNVGTSLSCSWANPNSEGTIVGFGEVVCLIDYDGDGILDDYGLEP